MNNMSSTNGVILDSKKVKALVLQFLKDLVVNAKGQLVTFRPAKVAQEISLKTRRSPRAESVVIRNFFEELVEYKLIQVVKKSARGKVYGIYRNSILWNALEKYDVEYVLSLIESIVRGEKTVEDLITLNLNNTSKINFNQTGINEKTTSSARITQTI